MSVINEDPAVELVIPVRPVPATEAQARLAVTSTSGRPYLPFVAVEVFGDQRYAIAAAKPYGSAGE